ncbi:craniofacial development protein 1 [Drosophila kikkawai]|uniref:Craniofacial development protein 1 n=1 Tax=Drosophila kikkawai TaxID=30033 RepID=A0A6P4J0Y3_DROKI|nr:craniofacial development protein 1 [Drosophila kikkawai]
MNQSNHTSDSESDEDYCVDGDNAALGSSDDTDGSGSEEPEESSHKYSKQRGDKCKPKNDHIDDVNISAPRHTRGSAASETIIRSSEKEELQSDEEADKTRSDTLWADFLCDVGSKSITKTETKSNEATGKTAIHINSDAHELPHTSTEQASDGSEKPLGLKKKYTNARVFAPKRPVESNSVSAVLNRFTKKKKMSVLEKSKVDWKDFKNDEGIDEELRTHNKGKDGYLERQDFLQRTDLRQFEIEKTMRLSSRQN